jgi:hypothetical protein
VSSGGMGAEVTRREVELLGEISEREMGVACERQGARRQRSTMFSVFRISG